MMTPRKLIKAAVHSTANPRLVKATLEPIFRSFRSPSNESFAEAKKILVIRLDGLGDTLMTSGFLRELRATKPNAEISLVVKPSVKPLMELCPYLSQVLTFDSFAAGRFGLLTLHRRALNFARQHIWGKNFDYVIVPRWEAYYDHEPFLAYLTGIPNRVGYSEKVSAYKARLSAGSDRLFTHVIVDPVIRHEVEYNFNLLRQLGGRVNQSHLELWLGNEDRAKAQLFYARNEIKPSDIVIAICPGAGIARRRWPIERFVEVAQWLQHKYSVKILFVGSKAEAGLAAAFRKKLGTDFLDAQKENFSIRESAAVLARSQLFVGNNTGPMHLAAASQVPIIELSCHPKSASNVSENSPFRFKAWQVPGEVIQPPVSRLPCGDHCGFDFAHCICGITVDQVQSVLSTFLELQLISEASPLKTAIGF